MLRTICCALAIAAALLFHPAATLAQTDVSAEITFWNSVKDTRDPEIVAYLNKYPNGTFASLAKIRLESLKPKTPASPPAEQWAAIGFAARGAWGAVWQKATRDEAEARALTLASTTAGATARCRLR